MEEPTVTAVAIVIPTLNRAALLRSSTASALQCEPIRHEVLVVDYGSPSYRRVGERRSHTSRTMGVRHANHSPEVSGHA
jgi:hypothetical protein